MKSFYRTQLLLMVFGGILIKFYTCSEPTLAFILGVIIATLNVILVQFVWGRILDKKSVAWTLFIIVFKYGILGITLYFVAAKGFLPIGWFSLGLGTILLSIFRIKLGSF